MSTGPMQQQPKPEGATTILVLGLLGVLVCAPVGIFAWIQGNDYMKRCQAMGVEPEGTAVAGRILGMIAGILMILSLVAIAGMMILGVLASAASA